MTTPISCSADVMKNYKDALQRLGVSAEDMRDFSKNYDDVLKAKGVEEAFARSSKIVQQKKAAAAIAKRTAAYNALKMADNLAYIERVWADDRFEGLMSLVSDSAQARPRARRSAESVSNALSNTQRAALLDDLDRAGLLDLNDRIHADPAFERDIVRGIYAMNMQLPTTGINADALRAATILKRHNDYSRIENVKAGGIIGERADYTFTPNYDPNKVRQLSQAEWSAKMLGWLDEEQTFAEFYHLKDTHPERYAERVQRFMFTAYRHITTGLNVANAADAPAMAPSSLRKNENWRHSHQKVFIYKGPDEVLSAHKLFGDGTVFDSTMHTIDRRWRSTGIMRTLGPSAQHNLARMTGIQIRSLDVRDATQSKKFAEKADQLYRAMAIVDGSAFASAAGGAARGLRAVRTMQNFRLGRAALAALFGDPIIMAMDRATVGLPFIAEVFNAFWARFGALSKTDRIRMAKAAGFELESVIASPWMRTDPERNYGGTLSKSVSAFMRWTGLPLITERGAAAHADGLMRLMGEYRHTGFDDLPAQMQRDLSSGGIDKAMWEHYREHGIDTFERENGQQAIIMTPEAVDRAPDSVYADMAKDELNEVSEKLTTRLEKLDANRTKVVQQIGDRIYDIEQRLAALDKMEGDATKIAAERVSLKAEQDALAFARQQVDSVKMVEILLAIEEGADVERTRTRKAPADDIADYIVEDIGKDVQSWRILANLTSRERNSARNLGVKLERARRKVAELRKSADEGTKETMESAGKRAGKQALRVAAIDESIRKAYDEAQRQAAFIIQETRYRAQDTLRAYYQRHIASAMAKPYARSASFMQAGTAPGSFAREASSAFWQFKTFGVNVVARNIMQVLYGRSDYQGVYSPFSFTTIKRLGGKNGEFRMTAQVIVASMVAGMMTQWAREITAGRKPTIPEEPEEYRNFMLGAIANGGALGYMGDLTHSALTWEGGYSMSSMLGPTAQELNTGLTALGALTKGDVDSAKKTSVNYLLNKMPNTFMTKAAWEWGVAANVRHIIDPDWQERYENTRRQKGAGEPYFPFSEMQMAQ
jgi:hypothetical protein